MFSQPYPRLTPWATFFRRLRRLLCCDFVGFILRSSASSLLERDPPLQFDDATGESLLREAEGRAVDLRAGAVEVERLKVEQVEDVEEVRLDFEEPSFAAKGSPKRLARLMST